MMPHLGCPDTGDRVAPAASLPVERPSVAGVDGTAGTELTKVPIRRDVASGE